MRKAIFLLMLSALCLCLHSEAQSLYQVPFPRPLHDRTDTVSIVITGDVMMHTRQLRYDCHPFLKNVSHLFKNADFAAANMEFSLGGKPYSGYPAFSAPDYYPGYVAGECGVNIFLMGNNHILDRGEKGLRRTLGIYSHMRDSLGIRYTGASSDQQDRDSSYPLIISRKGIKIAIVNFTYGTNMGKGPEWPDVNYMRKPDVGAAIQAAKDQGADFTVVIPHWGTEYQLAHSQTQEDWAKWLVAQGADVIVGGHPHVVQDTTHINGVPVVYSMGNAVSNMSAINTRLGLAVILRFINNRTSQTMKMLEPKLIFLWCTLPGTLTTSYSSIIIKEWAARRNEWLTPSDYDEMMSTYQRVKDATGIKD